MMVVSRCILCFFFNDTATTEIYTLSLHDALPIYERHTLRHDEATKATSRESRSSLATITGHRFSPAGGQGRGELGPAVERIDRKSTRLNSSHMSISYAVFCLKKKNTYSKLSRTST